MAGRFMDKETVESEAIRLGISLEGLTWPQKQKAIMEAQKLEKNSEKDIILPVSRMILGDEIEQVITEEIPSKEVHVHIEQDYDPMEEMRGKEVLICPEMAPTSVQLFGYDEEIGEEIEVEEVVHDVDAAYRAAKDWVTGTYRVTNKTGKKVIARTALPKEGCGIVFMPDRDYVPVVIYQGRKGYLWTHHRLPNIKQLLLESGYYEKYRERFADEPFIWHAAGKLLACDINLVHSIFQEIEEKEQAKRLQREQNEAYMRKQMEM